MIAPKSDLDILGANWLNVGSLMIGATVAAITVVAIAALAHLIIDANTNELLYNVILASAVIISAAFGGYISYHLIGIIAQSSFLSIAVAFTASAGGALSGLTLSIIL